VFDPEAADFPSHKREGVWNGVSSRFHNTELKFPPMTLHDTASSWKNYQEHDINFSVFFNFARANSYDRRRLAI
jgi:hypothetical protein